MLHNFTSTISKWWLQTAGNPNARSTLPTFPSIAPILESVLLKHSTQRLLPSEAGKWVCMLECVLQANKYVFHWPNANIFTEVFTKAWEAVTLGLFYNWWRDPADSDAKKESCCSLRMCCPSVPSNLGKRPVTSLKEVFGAGVCCVLQALSLGR